MTEACITVNVAEQPAAEQPTAIQLPTINIGAVAIAIALGIAFAVLLKKLKGD